MVGCVSAKSSRIFVAIFGELARVNQIPLYPLAFGFWATAVSKWNNDSNTRQKSSFRIVMIVILGIVLSFYFFNITSAKSI